MKHTLLTVAVLFMSTSLTAQTGALDSTRVSADCLLGMQAIEWSSLGLSTEQMEQVRGIQTECKTACAAHQASGTPSAALSDALLEKHQERIGRVLSREQYDKWIAMCAQRGGDTRLTK